MSKKVKTKAKSVFPSIEWNDKFLQALELINKGENVFITGRAGTGKSTLLNYIRRTTDQNVAVLAPTGVAAVNIAGQTLHSFFGFRPDTTWDKIRKKYKPKDKNNIYAKLDAIIIDEISMVRADVLDMAEKFLRLNTGNKERPFGGVQMIFIGDLYQLPPVLTGQEKKAFEARYNGPYFFNSRVIEEGRCGMDLVELDKIYRQKDQRFIDFLNKVRNNSVTEEELEEMNDTCCRSEFEPEAEDLYVHLTPTNQAAARINDLRLKQLTTKKYIFSGKIRGEFEEKNAPAPRELMVKPGAQVMLVNNDKAGRWVNGTIAKVEGVETLENEEGEKMKAIMAELPDGNIEPVLPVTWHMYRFVYDSEVEAVESETVGSFTQYPLRLAWAVTIHKAQGKTFEKMILDMGKGAFAHGQTYVALSRCASLDGLVLKRELAKKDIWMDWRVVKFLTGYQYQISEEELSLEKKMDLIENAIEKEEDLKITYLKANDTKSERVISPFYVGEEEYMNKIFPAVRGYCHNREEERVFRVDRILKIEKM